jgi:dephospho-CoA kinase
MSLPYRIGLTGNIATGKTTVGRILEEQGAVLIDADRVAHTAMSPGGTAYSAVTRAFGPDILSRDGVIDRRKLGSLVFSDPAALRELESLVHPAVIRAVEHQIAVSRAPVVVVEAIKLIESGMAAAYDALWVTVCEESTQVSRLIEHRGYDNATALQRIRAQPPQAEKVRAADVVITTEGTLASTRAQVEAAWDEIGPRLTPHDETHNV